MKIDIWFDFICPFSYLGKKRFDKALKQFKHNKEVKVQYHNYCIAPYIQNCLDMNAHEYLAYHKDISYEEAKEINEKLKAIFDLEGINVNFEKLKPTTSKKAHQILNMISDIDAVNAYIDHVFKAHFEDGKDIGKLSVLVDIGKKVGLEQEDVEAVYNTDMYEPELNRSYEESKDLGLTGVPAFVVNRKYYLLGGQPYSAFVELLDNMYEREKIEYCTDEYCIEQT